ncbi:MAG: transcription-repair coupling factor [Betaproteobacteria bacterium]|nr:MAG: transcription-repair coupling factor [Betaproteobacteria bacterium]
MPASPSHPLFPTLPRTGERAISARLPGAATALGLARLSHTLLADGRTLIVVCADAADVHHLALELSWFAPSLRVREFSDWETLAYDHFSPHPDLVSDRLQALYALANNRCDVLLVSATTASQKLSPRSFIAARTFSLKKGQRLAVTKLREQMTLGGYTHVTQVVSQGEFAVRGGIIDIYPTGAALPVRIDLFDEDIESIKTFEPDSQRTLYPTNELSLLPAREFPTDEAGRTQFRQRFREAFEGDPSKSAAYKDVSNGIFPGGIEYYLPLFFDAAETLFDHAPTNAVFAMLGDIHDTLTAFEKETKERWGLLRGDSARPLLEPGELYLGRDDFLHQLKNYSRYEFKSATVDDIDATARRAPALEIDRRRDQPLSNLTDFLQIAPGRVLLTAESAGRVQTMTEMFAEHGLRPALVEDFIAFTESSEKFCIAAAPLFTGTLLVKEKISIITESELYPTTTRQTRRKRAKTSNVDSMLKDLSEVKVGDPVVHEEHGIGRYLGLVSLDLGDGSNEFLHLEYANGAKLYVPVSNLHLITRYSGTSPEHAPLHVLGSGQWEKVKKKAAQQARDTAAELLNIYAQRAARVGHAFKIDWSDYAEFAAGFKFEETPDQSAAIQCVIQDLVAAKPMDRLVCGDVGFGKTEVALRAAFVALMGGKQVAVLVPTTLLAEQHFSTFKDRFAAWPLRVEELSRFRSAKEVKVTLDGLANGTVDLVIGTHKLIQPDIKFKNLGLVIIDEEHRFGVRQKEQLKKMRAEVDMLTLTATPIPRTLAMSLEGIRDFSVIATAPQKRLAIKTFVAKGGDGIIREAVMRELKRGGQVYFLHNEIDTIENMRERLEAIVPEARVRVGHGQMGGVELEGVMRDFYQQRFQILLCSTIIETGIDVANANTILINRADKFGLAQLHQLRGRVGRSHHQAYAYMLIPGEDAISADAKKRLEAITQLEDLGAGFYLSMHDLEIRGAGEVLGDNQSGEMQQIGFSLYSEMLNQAVKALKSGREPDLDEPLGVTTEVNLHVPALLPDDYCAGVHERLVIYKRLANCETLDVLEDLKEELIDRFGLLPEPAEALVGAHQLRIAGKALGVKKIDSAPERSIITFKPKPTFEPIKLIQLIQKDGRYRFHGQDKIKIERPVPALAERQKMLREFFGALS